MVGCCSPQATVMFGPICFLWVAFPNSKWMYYSMAALYCIHWTSMLHVIHTTWPFTQYNVVIIKAQPTLATIQFTVSNVCVVLFVIPHILDIIYNLDISIPTTCILSFDIQLLGAMLQ